MPGFDAFEESGCRFVVGAFGEGEVGVGGY
jgi:hypothetical protein